MRVVGFNFTKISIEKLKESVEGLKTNTEIEVPEIKEIKSDIWKTKEDIIEAKFEYKVKYEPGFADINLSGRILIAADPKIVKDILKQWKKKKISEDFRIFLFNIILRKSALKALYLEDELNLPLHMPMPSFKRTTEEK